MELKIEHLRQSKDKAAVNDAGPDIDSGIWGLWERMGQGNHACVQRLLILSDTNQRSGLLATKRYLRVSEVYWLSLAFCRRILHYWISMVKDYLSMVAERYSSRQQTKDQSFVGLSFRLTEKEKSKSVRRHEASCWYWCRLC